MTFKILHNMLLAICTTQVKKRVKKRFKKNKKKTRLQKICFAPGPSESVTAKSCCLYSLEQLGKC